MTISLDDAAKLIVRARAGLILDQPFFGSLALRLQPKADPTCKTLWTDGKTLGYNPTFIATLTLDQLKGSIAHEVMHVAQLHHTRMQDRDRSKWNKAADMAINPLLRAANFDLPTGALDGRGDKSAEQLYADFPPDDPPSPPPDDPSGQGSPNQPPQGGSGPPPPPPPPQPGQGQQPPQPPPPSPGPQPPDPNSQPQPGQGPPPPSPGKPGPPADPDPGNCGEVREAPPSDVSQAEATPADLSQAEEDAKVGVQQAVALAKACGKLPAGMERALEDVLDPPSPWRDILRRFVDEAAKNDYTWRRPSPRYLASGVYLPSLYSEELRPVVIAVDTSGSISESELATFGNEVNAIHEDLRVAVTAIFCDATVAGVQEFAKDEAVKLTAKGRGGTDFRPPFVEVERRALLPSCFIYLTDGECSSFPKVTPDYPVLWALTGDWRRFKPPFGEVVGVQTGR